MAAPFSTARKPLEPTPALVARLAEEHDAHLQYVSKRYHASLSPDEAAEVVQAAYESALKEIATRSETLHFASYDKARGWLRRLLDYRAVDALRARDGKAATSAKADAENRAPDAPPRSKRPALVSLDALTDGSSGDDGLGDHTDVLVDDSADFVATLIDDAHRDHKQDTVERAIRLIKPKHGQLLRWRHFDNLAPQAIAELLDITVDQYERRMRSALAALRPKVASLVGVGCPQIRLLLDRDPALLLDRNALMARDGHLASCEPCRAFALQLRGALAIFPLPLLATAAKGGLLAKVTSWFGYSTHSSSAASAPTATGASASSATAGAGAGVATKGLATVVAIATVATGAATAAKPDSKPPTRASQRIVAPATPAPIVTAPPTVTPAPERPKARSAKPKPKPKKRKPTTAPRVAGAATPQPTPVATPVPTVGATPGPTATRTVRNAPAPAPEPSSSEFSQEFAP